jgi:gliding motility-associated protein GldM
MIGMMYLVLTALLALNVSKQVLDAFSKINNGIVKTTKNFSLKNDDVYNEFNLAAETNPTKAGPWRDKAFTVKAKSDSLVDLIQSLKFNLTMMADGGVTLEGENLDKDGKPQPIKDVLYKDLNLEQKNKSITKIRKKKDRLSAGNYLVKEPNGQNLVNMLESYREYALGLLDDDFLSNSISETMSYGVEKVNVGAKKADQTWLERNFNDMPLVAAVTLLSKVQTDIRNTESDVINYLKQEIDAGSLKFTSADAIQIANSNYVFLGDSFKADVFLAAKDTTQNPIIFVGDYELDENGKYKMLGDYDSIPVLAGKGKYSVKTSSQGYKKWGGLISMKTDAGDKIYPFNGEYQVAKPSLVISPTKMNVFYILASHPLKDGALGNPVDVSVPGVPKDKISVSCDNGVVKKLAGGGWEVFPKKTGRAKVNVVAQVDGKRKNMGSLEFRVMRTPKPEPKFLGSTNQKIKKSQLLSNNAKLYAELSNFVFDIRYRITGFSVDVTQRGELVTKYAKGNKVTGEMKTLFESLQIGSVIYFTNITCKGPDGAPKSLPSVKLTVN